MNRPPNFNRLAGVYRWMEFFSFGPWLALTRRTFLSELADCRRGLVLGDGDGRFSALLLQVNPTIRLEAVDGSEAMLDSLLRRAGANGARVQARRMDVRDWRPAGAEGESGPPYDLIATHFFLDCLADEDVRRLAAVVRLAATPGARWVVSEFAVPQGWFGRWIARPLVAGLYLSFGLLTGLGVRRLPDFESALDGAGFRLAERRTRLAGLLVAEVWVAGDGKM